MFRKENNINKCILFICFIFLSINTKAQDLIIKEDGTEIQAKITEVTSTEVKFKRWDNIDGPTYIIPSLEIYKIIYQNGSKEVFGKDDYGVILKKINITFELGRSPFNREYYRNYRIKKYPFFGIAIGFNTLTNKNNYFIPTIGLAWEEAFNYFSDSRRLDFTYTDSIMRVGTKNEYWANSYHKKSVYATFGLNLQHFYSPFKNKDTKASCLIGFTVKPIVWNEIVNRGSYTKDSTTIKQRYVLVSNQYDHLNRSKIKIDGAVDFMFNMSPGLLFGSGKVKHQTGLNFILQITAPNASYYIYGGAFIRAFYSINF